MNNHQRGYHRDNAIITVLDEWGILNTDQLQMMFFSGLRMAQKRLQRLVEMKKVYRYREYTGQPYHYYTSIKRPGQPDHKLGVNWIRLWLQNSIKSWETLYQWEYEPNYKTVRPDAMAAIRNTITGKLRLCLIERECDTNPFKKIKLYNELYDGGGYMAAWWAKQVERFPKVVIVVESEARARQVRRLIEKENKNSLEFQVYILSQIISEVKGGTI